LTPGSIPEAPILLPDNDLVNRAITSFDRNSTVDGHRIGVIYIGDGQSKEEEILANTQGSPAYTEFVSQLGTLVRLKDVNMNTQGLDRTRDEDGRYAYCWRDRSTEVVFHVTTMMPTDLESDPRCNRKKAHIGNDFVNIIWNDSGADFNFNTFPSDFNYVYIVITPEVRTNFVSQRRHIEYEPTSDIIDPSAQAIPTEPPSFISTLFYKLQVLSAPGFPSISPAAESKLISAKALASFVRLLALNASYFSLVWSTREGGEHISPWRNRLREIKKLRDKYCVSGEWNGNGIIDGIGGSGGSTGSPTVGGAALAGAAASARNSSGLLQPPALGRGSQRGSMSFGGAIDGAF
jgi:Rap/ran-GAP